MTGAAIGASKLDSSKTSSVSFENDMVAAATRLPARHVRHRVVSEQHLTVAAPEWSVSVGEGRDGVIPDYPDRARFGRQTTTAY